MWSGARANYGVREGKVCYEVRLSEESSMTREHTFRDEPYTKGFRVGFSMSSSNLMLGESEYSFAYCESGRKATNGEFVEYAKSYQLDDVIGCYLDMESKPCNIKFTLNGEDLGKAFEFDKDILGENTALFPHILTKGYEYQVNFADNENLLVNVERKVRKRRKPRKIEDKKENKVNDDGGKTEDERNTKEVDDEDWDNEETSGIQKKQEIEENKEEPNREEETSCQKISQQSEISQESSAEGKSGKEDLEMIEISKTAVEQKDDNKGRLL